MPQKNTLKDYSPNSYYHIYTRGVNKQKIFQEPKDFQYFEYLLNRYFSGKQYSRRDGYAYPTYSNRIDIVSYCLMTNHIHILIYVHNDADDMKAAMRSLFTSYSKFYNQKHKRVGSLFESRYKAKHIHETAYLEHIHRYIHMNPRTWKTYKYSSLKFVFKNPPRWLKLDLIQNEFSNRQTYLEFLEAYQDNKDSISALKHNLANQ